MLYILAWWRQAKLNAFLPNNEMNVKSAPIKSIHKLQSHLKNPLNRCVLPLDKPAMQGPQILLCHDMAGGYLDDCWIQGLNTSSKVYNIQYWQYINIFCYFSHERITIPPVVWTNACHRNQVACLGTIIVEGREGIDEGLRLIYGPAYNPELPSTQRDYSPVYADILVELALYYGFDGYLVNIESPLPSASHCIVLRNFLKYFTKRMKELVPHGSVVWYDSVIYTGQLRWQDQINSNNQMFFDVCDAIFTNYTWNVKRLQESASNALDRKFDVFTGIDVWGRRTFGGGGFNVHKALREIQSAGTSVAIFAPAWTFERLGKDYFELSESRFWVDKNYKLPFSDVEINTLEIKLDENDNGCVAEIVEPKFITKLFYCSFDQGFGKSFYIDGKQVSSVSWQHLSRQSISVSFRLLQGYYGDVYGEGNFVGEICNSVQGKISQEYPIFQGGHSLYFDIDRSYSGMVHFLPLFRTNISLSDNFQSEIEILIQQKNPGKVGISHTCLKSGSVKLFTTPNSRRMENGWERLSFDLKLVTNGNKINGDLGICSESSITLGSFALVPVSDIMVNHTEVKLSILDDKCQLLTWDEQKDQTIDFRHIFIDEVYIGTSFSNQFVLDRDDTDIEQVSIIGKDCWNRTLFVKN